MGRKRKAAAAEPHRGVDHGHQLHVSAGTVDMQHQHMMMLLNHTAMLLAAPSTGSVSIAVAPTSPESNPPP